MVVSLRPGFNRAEGFNGRMNDGMNSHEVFCRILSCYVRILLEVESVVHFGCFCNRLEIPVYCLPFNADLYRQVRAHDIHPH